MWQWSHKGTQRNDAMPPTTAITKSLRTLTRRQAKLDQIDMSHQRAFVATSEAALETLAALYEAVGELSLITN